MYESENNLRRQLACLLKNLLHVKKTRGIYDTFLLLLLWLWERLEENLKIINSLLTRCLWKCLVGRQNSVWLFNTILIVFDFFFSCVLYTLLFLFFFKLFFYWISTRRQMHRYTIVQKIFEMFQLSITKKIFSNSLWACFSWMYSFLYISTR